jgi:hypothetical protein
MKAGNTFISRQPWIGKAWVDTVFILLPPFLCLILLLLFPSWTKPDSGLSDAGWVILILLIDVAHVYSTLYRTYFDPEALREQRSLLWIIPFASFVAGVLLYTLNPLYFWRVLAYVAVFHFVRQQYGFMRVYSRKEAEGPAKKLDSWIIYTVTLYPILFWHLKGPRNFHWFVEGDFVFRSAEVLLSLATVAYFAILLLFVAKEVSCILRTGWINLPKLGIIVGTTLSWYAGIVWFNGDMSFTLLNVVSHGIPYMALVWLYGRKQYVVQGRGSRFLRFLFSTYGIIVFLGLLFLFAFIEEGLWDLAVWKEHGTVLGTGRLPEVRIQDRWLSFLVPLLALPQVTHYILDGFIWKIRHDEFKWKSELRPEEDKEPEYREKAGQYV